MALTMRKNGMQWLSVAATIGCLLGILTTGVSSSKRLPRFIFGHPALMECSLDGPAEELPDQSEPALGMLTEHCPNQPLLCCTQRTVNDVTRIMQRSNITAVLDSFFKEQLAAVKAVMRSDLYRIGDVLVRTIPQEFDMIDPIELNLIRPNIQDIFCRASAEFAQDIDEPLCHHKGIESRAKANFILAGAYTNAAMTAMGYPGRLLSPQASRCVRAYSTRSYASYSRHVDSLSCTLHSLQCQVKPALLALQSTAEMIDRVRLLIHSEQFPGPRCKQALMDLTVCPYCAGMQAVPPCLSSCKHVLRTCLSEVMNDQLHEIFLPVISNSLNRLQTILASISDNLIQARKTIQKVILEANQDVTNRLDHRQLKEEINHSCHLSSILNQRYEPQACNNAEPLPDYRRIMQQAIETTQFLKHGFSKLDADHASMLCPKVGWPRLCMHSPLRPQHLPPANTPFKEYTQEIMGLFLNRNSHLFDFITSDQYRLLYDDEDSQGSYQVITEGSGSTSASGRDLSGDGPLEISGSGSGYEHIDFTPRPVIRPFIPLVCEEDEEPTTTTHQGTTRTAIQTTTAATAMPTTSHRVLHRTSPHGAARSESDRRPVTHPDTSSSTKTSTATPENGIPTNKVKNYVSEIPATKAHSTSEYKPSGSATVKAAPVLTISLSVLVWAVS
ncbi:uncharacterized protein LOC135805195 [Sycon ciliatum]|uniref:uncharacterized protein LOC135805195 n=1 Tax=Sycon ciliatum TaxID=27933 RepID=UPI0031F65D57